MLRTATANLPPEQQQRLHADFLANEQDYLRMRPALLSRYAGQWVAVDAGQVIAAGDDVQAVTQKAATKGGHAYIAFVGNEDGVVFRVRRVEFSGQADHCLCTLWGLSYSAISSEVGTSNAFAHCWTCSRLIGGSSIPRRCILSKRTSTGAET